MANQLALNGAVTTKPVRHTPIYTARFYNGLWTNRSPLRDAGSSHLEEKFYGARGDGLIDGLNSEISSQLTLIRRPGSSIYNFGSVGPVTSFYSFRFYNGGTEQIRVMVDTPLFLRDGTGPATETIILNKNYPNPGQTYMIGVGNTLYLADNVSQKKWIVSTLNWTANTSYSEGDFLTPSFSGSAGTIQEALGGQTASIQNIQIINNNLFIFLDPLTTINAPAGTHITLTGLSNATFLNNQTVTTIRQPNLTQIVAAFVHADYPFTADTGTASTGNGITGSTQPNWISSTVQGQILQDAGQQWINRGSSVQNWGIAGPTAPPFVTQTPAPSIYPNWAANTYYFPIFATLDGSGNTQLLRVSGVTGGSTPAWNSTPGGNTTDGSATWQNVGNATRLASHAYSLQSIIYVTWTYYITYTVYQWNGHQNVPVQQQQAVTNTAFFQCVTAGTSSSLATNSVGWSAGTGTTTTDGTVVWRNFGSGFTWTASANVSTNTQILDSNGYVEQVNIGGKSGTTAPTWSTSTGATVTDGTVQWINQGPYTAVNTGAWIYAYSYGNSITGGISTASPTSAPVLVGAGNQPVISGANSSDPQVDTIYLWRTVQGGSTLFLLGTAPNIATSGSWIYTDTSSDSQLDELVAAPIASSNNPPPVGIGKFVYHLNRIWGAVNNIVYYSGGPDTVTGNGNETFPASNSFAFPSQVNRLFPTTIGLLVFTNSSVYIITGDGTANSPLISKPFLNEALGLASYNAFAVNGTTIYMMTTDSTIISLDIGSGVSRISLPIADQFIKPSSNWNPSTAYLTWHIDGERDQALFVADGSTGWFRLSPNPAPEIGLAWSPFAAITNGVHAVQSVETSPGVHKLLFSTTAVNSQIYQRDWSVNTDWTSATAPAGVPYRSYGIIGSVVPAQPGQLAEFVFLTLDSKAIGVPPLASVQIDEIAPLSGGLFESLGASVADPTELPPSSSLYMQRFYFSNTKQPALGRNLQILIDWGTDTVQNELLACTLFGGYSQES